MNFVRVNDGYIEIQATPWFVYEIAISQMLDDEKTGRMNWLRHLKDKRWFTPEIEHEFLLATRRLSVPFATDPDPKGAA